MKVIGISSAMLKIESGPFKAYPRNYINYDYPKAIANMNAIPLILPMIEDEKIIEGYLKIVDALILSGGHDVSPYLYNEENHPKLGETLELRDRVEYLLIKKAIEFKKPILGICRGLQLLNVYFGGTLHQDLSLSSASLRHSSPMEPTFLEHHVEIKKDSTLFEWLKESKIKVNSFHHQIIKDLAKEFTISALASDGVIEAFESKELNIYAVQWHPEMLYDYDTHSYNIFNEFIKRL